MSFLLNIIEFILLITINSIIPSILLLLIFNKYFNYEINKINVLISFILGQTINGLILFYLFLLIPGLSNIIYILFILVIQSCLFLLTYKNNISIIKKLKVKLLDIYKSKSYKYVLRNLISNKISILISIYLIFGFMMLLFRGLVNHDTLSYALYGNALTDVKEIFYSPYIYFEKIGTYKSAFHGYGFPMFKVIENLFNINNNNSDLYYRFIPIINGLYLILLPYFYLKEKFNKEIAFYSSTLISLSGAFIFLIATYGSGSISYVLLIANIVLGLNCYRKGDFKSYIIFGISLGLAATIHSINLLLQPILIIAIFVINVSKFVDTINKIIVGLVISILFGSIHYLLEIVYGNGWILGARFRIFQSLGNFIDRIF